MGNSNPEEVSLAFRAPGANDWRTLVAIASGDEKQKALTARNKEELNKALLTSLQMQNLVVLAGSGCSQAAGGPSILDLWNGAVGKTPSKAANEVAHKVQHQIEDKNIEAFLSRIESYLDINEDDEVGEFLTDSKRVILNKCTEFVKANRLDAHQTFLHRLSRRRARDQRLRVFTTNYDLCFEETVGELGGVAIDGFSFTAPRRYDPRYFTYDIIRRPSRSGDRGDFLEGVFLLYKLHGSVNWARAKDQTIFQKASPDPAEACLIYPARGKYQQSYTQPYLESMANYLSIVREPNTCVLVVGFGFNDDHLAEPLIAAAKSNPHLRIILVDPTSASKVENGNDYWKEFAGMAERGEDIWFIAADFSEFAQLIPDLKSLTPADNLMKAVQDASRRQ